MFVVLFMIVLYFKILAWSITWTNERTPITNIIPKVVKWVLKDRNNYFLKERYLTYIGSLIFVYITSHTATFYLLSAQVVPGILVLLISYLGCDIELVLVLWFIAVTMITASYAGAMANVVDIGKYTFYSFVYFCFHLKYFKQNIITSWTKTFGPTSNKCAWIHPSSCEMCFVKWRQFNNQLTNLVTII